MYPVRMIFEIEFLNNPPKNLEPVKKMLRKRTMALGDFLSCSVEGKKLTVDLEAGVFLLYENALNHLSESMFMNGRWRFNQWSKVTVCYLNFRSKTFYTSRMEKWCKVPWSREICPSWEIDDPTELDVLAIRHLMDEEWRKMLEDEKRREEELGRWWEERYDQ